MKYFVIIFSTLILVSIIPHYGKTESDNAQKIYVLNLSHFNIQYIKGLVP
jgi:hypothetical protein